jgi:hypothetical protein
MTEKAEQIPDEQHLAKEERTRADPRTELGQPDSDPHHGRHHADARRSVTLEGDRQRHGRQHRGWAQRHRQRQLTRPALGHRKRARQPEQPPDEHRQHGCTMVLGRQQRQGARLQADARRRLDPQRMGHLHKDVDEPDGHGNADHHGQRDQQLVQPRIKREKDINPLAHTRGERLPARATRPPLTMICRSDGHRRSSLRGVAPATTRPASVQSALVRSRTPPSASRAQAMGVLYCSSVTCSPQVTGLPESSASCMAVWIMKRLGAAPCQWFSPGSK